jgi:hypothetical protein
MIGQVSKSVKKLVKYSEDTIELLGKFGSVMLDILKAAKVPWMLASGIKKIVAFSSSWIPGFEGLKDWLIEKYPILDHIVE